MICEKDENQLQLFLTPFGKELDKTNRWISFSELITWFKVSEFYNKRMYDKNVTVTRLV